MCTLLIIYINRGLFVATPGIEMSSTVNGLSSEVNSLLEVFINLAGGHNDIDEDGDCPEAHNSLSLLQPLFVPNSVNLSGLSHKTVSHKKFYFYNEAIPPLSHFGVIEQPPEQLTIEKHSLNEYAQTRNS